MEAGVWRPKRVSRFRALEINRLALTKTHWLRLKIKSKSRKDKCITGLRINLPLLIIMTAIRRDKTSPVLYLMPQ